MPSSWPSSSLLNDAVRLDTNQTGAARWEIKLQRRVIGPYAMKLTYQIPIAATRRSEQRSQSDTPLRETRGPGAPQSSHKSESTAPD